MNFDMNITLKKATHSDIDLFLNIENTVRNNKLYSVILDREEIRKEIEKNIFYFIKVSNKLVGYISYEIKNPKEAYISGLVVAPKFQGKGIARKAIEIVLGELSSFKKIWFVTHPDNIKSIKLYQSFGFKIGERIEDYFGDGQPRIKLYLTR